MPRYGRSCFETEWVVLVSDPLRTEVSKTSARGAGLDARGPSGSTATATVGSRCAEAADTAVKEMPAQPEEIRHERLRMTGPAAGHVRIAGTVRATIPSAAADRSSRVGSPDAPYVADPTVSPAPSG